MRGKVIKSTGSYYHVYAEDQLTYICRIKGLFRTKGIKTTNPIAVGDFVDIDLTEKDAGIIHHLFPRHNYFIRKSVNPAHQWQIVASNMDQAALVATLIHPCTSLGFIDRFLVTCEAYHISAMLLFNKYDLYHSDLEEYLNAVKGIYEPLGYPCYEISALTGLGVEELKQRLFHKTTLLTGHSGAGKSSFINALCLDKKLKTTPLSPYHEKGMHTTTFAELFHLEPDIELIDTPGIKELGVIDIESHELSGYFPEMKALVNQCRFHNCKHLNEPDCAVLDALEKEHIASSRYKSYYKILHKTDSRA